MRERKMHTGRGYHLLIYFTILCPLTTTINTFSELQTCILHHQTMPPVCSAPASSSLVGGSNLLLFLLSCAEPRTRHRTYCSKPRSGERFLSVCPADWQHPRLFLVKEHQYSLLPQIMQLTFLPLEESQVNIPTVQWMSLTLGKSPSWS
jgi:hypothetical protein